MSHEQFTHTELERKAAEVMLHFDFEKVHKFMQEQGWRWHLSDDTLGVPSREEIEQHARSLLTQAVWHKDSVVNLGSGGFMAYKLPWGVQLSFNIEQAGC